MADIEAYRGGDPISRSAGSNTAGVPGYVVLRNVIEAGEIDGGAAATDTIRIMDVPAGMVVQGVVVEVVTAQATVTVDVGDATDPNGWVAAQATAATGSFLGAGAYVTAGGKLYAADTELVMTPAAATMDTAEIRVVVFGVHTG